MTGQLVKALDLANGNPGMIDLESRGNFLYALSPGNETMKAAVAVFEVSGEKGGEFVFYLPLSKCTDVSVAAKQIQNFNPGGVGDSAQGMATL